MQELRHAFRMLARNPGFTAVAALSVALGIGANSAIFSLHDAILLRPLPVRDPGSVVTVTAASPDDRVLFSGGRLLSRTTATCGTASQSFDGLVAYQLSTFSFARSRQTVREMRMGMLVSDNFFDVLGIQPVLGRRFTPEEGQVPGRDAVAVLGHDFWKNMLAEDRSVLGGVVLINGIEFNVDRRGAGRASPAWIRSSGRRFTCRRRWPSGSTRRSENPLEDRAARTFIVKGRLKPGVSRQGAQAELTTLWKGLEQQYPDANRNRTMAVRSELQERIRSEAVDRDPHRDDDGAGGDRPDHCLRECREPDAGPGPRPIARDGDPARPGRQPDAAAPAVADGEPAAGAPRQRARTGIRLRRDSLSLVPSANHGADGSAGRDRAAAGSPRPGLQRCWPPW